VRLNDGSTVEIAGQKVLETQAGALMVMGPDREPARVIAAGEWRECSELGREGVPR
jgi:hypothetical protein